MKAIEVKALTKRPGQARGVEQGEIFGYLDPIKTRIDP